jgi:hypothetical protein
MIHVQTSSAMATVIPIGQTGKTPDMPMISCIATASAASSANTIVPLELLG